MTHLLEQALAQVIQLSDEQQDAIAAIILEELEQDLQWEQSFADSQDQLANWELKVQEDIQAGRVKIMGFDKL